MTVEKSELENQSLGLMFSLSQVPLQLCFLEHQVIHLLADSLTEGKSSFIYTPQAPGLVQTSPTKVERGHQAQLAATGHTL